MRPITVKTTSKPSKRFPGILARKISSSNQERFLKVLGQKLNTYNKQRLSPFNWKNVSIEVRDSRRKLVGGIFAGTYWGWLFVKMLWIDEKYRDRGIGKQILCMAEKIAKKRGCRYVHLDTFSFQAPGFYRKLGFKRFGTLKPFPKGSQRYFLYKKIA